MTVSAGIYYKCQKSEPFLLKDGNNKGWHFSLSRKTETNPQDQVVGDGLVNMRFLN